MTNASPPEARAGEEDEEGMTGIDEAALVVGQQNICKKQTRLKSSELMCAKIQSCDMLGGCDKEIKIAVRVRTLDLSSRSIKHDINTLDLSIIPEVA